MASDPGLGGAARLAVLLPRRRGEHRLAASRARAQVVEGAVAGAAGDGDHELAADAGERRAGVGGTVGENELLPVPRAGGAHGAASTGLAGEGPGGGEHEQAVLAGPQPAGGQAAGDEVDVDLDAGPNASPCCALTRSSSQGCKRRGRLHDVSVGARRTFARTFARGRGTLTAAQLVAATAAAVFAVLVAYRAYQRRPVRAAVGVAVAVLLVLYAAEVVTGVPDPQAEIERSGDALGRWAYLVVAGMAFFETGAPPFTLVFPGEWGVAFGGLLARQGEIDLVPLVLVVWATSLLGDSWSFYLGRRFGRGYLVRRGTRFGVTHERLEALDAFFTRWGPATVAVGRLVPFARPLVPLVAGASGWPYRAFLPWNLLGTGVFAVAFTVLGYAAYATAERVVEIGGDAALIVIPVGLALVALGILMRRRVAHRE